MASPSARTLVDGLPPLKKWATEGGPSDSAYDPYDPDNWVPGTYIEDYLDYGRAESSSTGPATQGRKKGDDGLHRPEIVPLMKRNTETQPVASLPASITGVLPRPLGKTATRPVVQAWKWFDECDVNDLWLDALYQEARAISGQERNLAQHVAFTRVTGNLHKIAKPDVFPVEDNLPDDIRHWIAYWSRNPFGIPRPIREEHGFLIVEDIDVWLWGRHVAPKAYKDKFLDILWEIFVPLGQWEELVDRAWVVPTTQALHSLLQDMFQEWPPGVTPKNLDNSHLVRWLGQKGGVTPTRARNLIEPYAHHCAQGLYYSPQVQDAYNRGPTEESTSDSHQHHLRSQLSWTIQPRARCPHIGGTHLGYH